MSYRSGQPDGLDLHTGRAMRSHSISSDMQSASGRSIAAAAAPPVNPQPAYVAATGASQLVSTEVGSDVSISASALVLLNNFLDQVLYNLLSSAHSTNLAQLKSTVPIVLKPRLGKAALQAADEELREYLEDSDDEESHATNGGFEPKSNFDLDLAWKLARLRCMVYTRLGDLEEEDEEEYIEQEQLHDQHRGSPQSVFLGPTSAIFLTSILEYLGEQALYYAAQHAQKRAQAGKIQEKSHDAHVPESSELLILEEVDMSQVGRESPLSRLWRSWRRNMRNPREPVSRPMSPETFVTPTDARAFGSRKNSIGVPIATINQEQQSMGQVLGSRSPSQLPLPMSDRDIDEIEVPGLAREIVDDEKEEQPPIPVPERSKRRPNSMLIASEGASVLSSPTTLGGPYELPVTTARKPKPSRTRSHSQPMPARRPFIAPRDGKAQDGTSLGEPGDNEVDEIPGNDDAPGAGAQPPQRDIEGASTNDELGGTGIPVERPLMDSSSKMGYSKSEHEQLGKVAAAVSVVAGGLGMGVAAATYGTKEQRDLKPAKTVAEEFLGLSSNMPPPKDAVTGSHITSVDDFNNIYVPVARPPPELERPSHAEAEGSDPEDLALSSADEGPSEGRKENISEWHDRHQSEKRDTTTTGTSFYHDADDEIDDQPNREAQANPAVANVERATAVPQSHNSGAVNNKAGHTRVPSNHQSVTLPAEDPRPSTAIAEPRSAQPPVSPGNGREVFADARSRPSTAGSATVPARFSSASKRAAGHLHANSKSSEYSHHSKSSSSSSKLLGFDREEHNRSQQSSRGGDSTGIPVKVNRSARSGTTGTAKESSVSNSGSPKSPKRLRLRTEAEEDPISTDPIDEANNKSLDVLINSDETLHYTLTPASARGEHFPIPPERVTHTQDLADFLRNTKPPPEDSAGPKTARSVVQAGLNGRRTNSAQADGLTSTMPTVKVIPPSKNDAAAPFSPKPRNILGGPRDPRVDQNTTRDLADYARSTGPESTRQLPKVLSTTAPPASAAAGIAAATAYSRSAMTTSHSDRPPATAASKSSQSSSRLKYQPRDARPSRHAETAELIDFIREGPPRAPGDHRIDRNVAPFRRTMDSEDLNALAPERDQNGTSSVTSTQDSSVATKSMQESTNSRTGLLESTNRSMARQVNGGRTAPAATLRKTALAEERSMPKRTRRSVRDPYAISESEDELDDDLATPKANNHDESLIDFLRNTAPTPAMQAQPVVAAGSSKAASSTVRKEPSSSALKDRLLRKTSSAGANQNANITRSTALPPPGSNTAPEYNRAAGGAREESPHLSQVGSKIDSYRPTQPTHASHVDRNRQKPRTAIQPRDPRTGGDTRDLAAYLKSSGPPEPLVSTQDRPQPIKEEAGFLKFFSRRSFRK